MVESQAERLAKLEKTVQELDDVVLGRWDMIASKRVPGIVERMDCINGQLSIVIKILRYGIGPLIIANTVLAIGGPVKEIVPVIAKIALNFIGVR